MGIASEFKEDDGLFTVLNRKKLEGYLEREFECLCVLRSKCGDRR